MSQLLEQLNRIEEKLDRIISTPTGRREVVPDAVTVAIMGGPDALLEFNKRERAKELRKKKAQAV